MAARIVIELQNLVGGSASAYITNGAVVGLSGANFYPYLVRKSVHLSKQELRKDCKTTFPELNFEALDYNLAVSALLANNSAYKYTTTAVLWWGDDTTNFSSFTRLFTGWMEEPARKGWRLNFTCGSIFRRIDYPITPVTGAGELSADVTDPTVTTFTVKNPVNLAGLTGANLLLNGSFETGTAGAVPTSWTDDGLTKMVISNTAGDQYIGSNGVIYTDATNTNWHYIRQNYTVKPNGVYAFGGYVSSDGAGGQSSKYEILIESFDAGNNLLGSQTTGQALQPPDFIRVLHNGTTLDRRTWKFAAIAYVCEKNCSYIRCTIKAQGNGTAIAFDGFGLSSAQLARINRETVAAVSYADQGTTAGQLSVVRGLLGSMPMTHKAGDEISLFTPLRGHPLDIIQRLITTTAAGGNGGFDQGDGFGVGARIPVASINTTNFNLERNFATHTTDPTQPSTQYNSPWNEFDHSKYYMDFSVTGRIDSCLKFIEDEILRPLCAHLYQDVGGLLNIRVHRAAETADSNTITASQHINAGKIVDDVWDSRNEVVNSCTWQIDEDFTNANDSQGDSANGQTNMLTERTIREVDLGDGNSPSLTQFGEMNQVFKARGVRGVGSRQLGICDNNGGDQMVWERSRVWIQRRRFPLQKYPVRVSLDRIGLIGAGSLPALTTGAVVNGASGVLGRTAFPTYCEDYALRLEKDAYIEAGLWAAGDIVALAGNAAAPMSTPQPNDWDCTQRTQTGTGTNWFDTGDNWRPMPRFPRRFANLAWMTLFYGGNSAPIAPSPRKLASVTVTAGGTGYTTAPSVTVSAPADGGTAATVHAVVAAGAVTQIIVDNGGGGYRVGETITFTIGGPGTGATASAVLATTSDYLFTRVYAYAALVATAGIDTTTNNAHGTTYGLATAWSAATTYTQGQIVSRVAGGLTLEYQATSAAGNLNKPPESNVPTYWTVYPATTQMQVAAEIRGSAFEAYHAFFGATAPTGQTQKVWARIAYVNSNLVEGTWSDLKTIIIGASPDRGNRFPRRQGQQAAYDSVRSVDGTTRFNLG